MHDVCLHTRCGPTFRAMAQVRGRDGSVALRKTSRGVQDVSLANSSPAVTIKILKNEII